MGTLITLVIALVMLKEKQGLMSRAFTSLNPK